MLQKMSQTVIQKYGKGINRIKLNKAKHGNVPIFFVRNSTIGMLSPYSTYEAQNPQYK